MMMMWFLGEGFQRIPVKALAIWVQTKIAEWLLDESSWDQVQFSMTPRWCILMNLLVPWLFLWHHCEIHIWVKNLFDENQIKFLWGLFLCKFCTHVHVIFRVNCNNVGYPICHLASSSIMQNLTIWMVCDHVSMLTLAFSLKHHISELLWIPKFLLARPDKLHQLFLP